MDERMQFVADYTRQLWPLTQLCDRYGISRKTGYKWIDRYEQHGSSGLTTRSSRPLHSPQSTDAAMVKAIIAVRRRHGWGAKKIIAVLGERQPAAALPAVSTANDILKRAGLARRRRRHRPVPPALYRATMLTAPNQVWTADFKGQFRTRNGQLCYPLTICDGWSRFLLRCHALPSPTTAAAREIFRRAFREYGLPNRIRTDNGEPFAAATSLGRLSRLSVEWIRLGIYPELIAPGSPQQNGAHERMHRTLKADTTRPPAATLRGQHARFAAFRRRYNRVRPHEALGQQPPARWYRPSARPWPRVVEPLVYPGHYERRRIVAPGVMWWHSTSTVVSTVLIGETIGLEPIDDGEWDLHFGPIRLGRFDERTRRIQPAARRQP